MSRTQSDVFEDVVRKAAEIEFDEGNPREIFDRIGLRPYINAELEELRRECEEADKAFDN
tara:strand:+ start:207 stop:386 length:180 start_codon:yes stop_codon:yes gene_type:complete